MGHETLSLGVVEPSLCCTRSIAQAKATVGGGDRNIPSAGAAKPPHATPPWSRNSRGLGRRLL